MSKEFEELPNISPISKIVRWAKAKSICKFIHLLKIIIVLNSKILISTDYNIIRNNINTSGAI